MTIATQTATDSPRADLAPWLIVALGLAVMYVPSFVDLFNGIWSTDQQAHGPIVLAISIWLLYRKWPEFRAAARGKASPFGWPILAMGLLLYVIGRSQNILLFEIGSLIWMLVAIGALFGNIAALRVVWFPLFFMIFMIPLPSVAVDAVTLPMKTAVSMVTEHLLYWLGYPIAHSGVILQIGQYQLLVADACAGLHTLFTLEALGLLYLNLVRHDSPARNITLAALIVPISFSANVIRVTALTLVTYYLGDEAGQGFLHGFAGMVLFLSALLLIIVFDSMIRFGASRPAAPAATEGWAPQ